VISFVAFLISPHGLGRFSLRHFLIVSGIGVSGEVSVRLHVPNPISFIRRASLDLWSN